MGSSARSGAGQIFWLSAANSPSFQKGAACHRLSEALADPRVVWVSLVLHRASGQDPVSLKSLRPGPAKSSGELGAIRPGQ